MLFTTPTGELKRRLVPAFVVLAVALSACGGDDSDQAADDPETAEPAADEEPGGEEPGGEDVSPEIQAAADEAEANGMLFITSREELERLANENGPITAYISADEPDMASTGFSEEWGVDTTAEDFSGGDAYTRFLLEAESGALSGIDVMQSPPEVYYEFNDLLAPYDILGMAEHGILDIPIEMIDPENRNVAAVGSQIGGFAYNPTVVDEADLPTAWEDFCNEDVLGGGDFFLDFRPSNIAPLVAEWGEERVSELIECMVANEPLLVRGSTESLTRLAAGEAAGMAFNNHHSCTRVAEEAPDSIVCALLDPVPVRLSNALGVMNEDVATNPYAALLFIEWMAGPGGQEVLDADPLKSSIHAEDSDIRDAIGDMSFSGGEIDDYLNMDSWMGTLSELLEPPS